MICNICKKDFKSNRSLGIHIVSTHNMTTKQYYDLYLKKENEGACLNCNKPTQYRNITKGYRLFCSKNCCNTSDYHITNMQNTIISRYGGMGTASNIINNKIKKTNIQKYGSENVYSSEYGKNKIKQSNLEHFGVECSLQSPIVRDKIIQTSLKKYNTTNPGNCRQGRQKAAYTRRANDNDSSWEDYFEIQLKQRNITYKKRYNSDSRYPFMCDFYLPNSDTFIEINGYWSHGKHWFNKNSKEDVKKLSSWIEKANNGHKQYKNAINVWTIKDVKKLQTAKKNKLNYIVIWKFEDIDKFFSNLKG